MSEPGVAIPDPGTRADVRTPPASAPSVAPSAAPSAAPSVAPGARYARYLLRVGERLSRYITRSNAIPIALVLLLIVAAGDYLTGVDVTFTFAYLAPIVVAL